MLDVSAGEDAPTSPSRGALEGSSPRGEGSGSKSWKQQKKDAVLRKASGGARVPAPTVEAAPEPPRVRRDSSEKEDSWSSKRAQAFLATHGGPRSPRASVEDMTQPKLSSPRAPGELSWTEKRKEAYRRKYGLERTEAAASTDVTISAGARLADSPTISVGGAPITVRRARRISPPLPVAHIYVPCTSAFARAVGSHMFPVCWLPFACRPLAVKFFVKLKSKAAAAQQQAGTEDAPPSTAPTRPASARKPGELTWTQKRKEAYLRKYGKARLENTTQADIAVTALSFASKLKVKANRTK